ncbi:MAG: K(+)-insensitive pyrophosphate-energized proton pump [Candidatus Woesebacteria bacterium GW2011_GWB1_38_5]|uniref:K(+)-insensitive pyrophosphate-energized proton pump n=3 Tax=Candidatus Woeseibacteriota TaxID=1752722 RepID=A0A0G0MJS2_9BACT|nr:MAG: K(+)-insensitive pyrophosphate-energized proton pump [Candidatus Woesebacteria bacterium GW2011_GWD1_38_10]KKQ57002.1 MAG: K(+)-insensitive pyrophosphate-energized proton pump [Candidatus Woesebacteria bacterium GW2011_GWC1_38_13]KKQ73984.1 MAG: K(+)-insensitive pyrophosphate-energized proton pump [Candidatus Woesebacteria bacterium GW2011_GWB1_38_5]
MDELNNLEQMFLAGVIGVAIISLIYAYWLWKATIRESKGDSKMQKVWNAIKIGAEGYLQKQLKTITFVLLSLTIVLFLSVYVVPPSAEAFARYGNNATLVIALGRTIAFIVGATFSTLVGQLGMRVAIQGNIRVTAKAVKGDYNGALTVAYRAGTFTGMLTDGLGLLGGTVIFIIFGKAAPDALLGFGFGGTLVALFMRIGGGIYTKAADVGADLVGKVEKNLPEDDPRNAGVVADLVGDNVGDCAGMAADIFESYEVTIVSSLILGLVLLHLTGDTFWIIYPLVVRAIGVFSSIIGTLAVPFWEKFPIRIFRARDAEEAMFRSYELSGIITVLAAFAFAIFYAGEWKLALLNAVGIGLAVVFNPLTSYFTSHKYKPVKEIVESTKSGPATTILSGLSVGMESSVWSVFVVSISIAISYLIYYTMPPVYMLYGVAMIGIGMLSLTGNNVAMDAFGPIADNANGIGEMSHVGKKAWKIMADLDAVGNTTKAITKQLAIASAVIAATALFFSFVTDVGIVQTRLGLTPLTDIRISTLDTVIGFLIGGSLPFLFSSYSIKAVAHAATKIVEEVRIQFKRPGVMEGTVLPEYNKVVAITTTAAQKDLISLVALSVTLPLIVGLVFKVEALGAFLAGVILVGQLMAVFMAVSGGALDNAKKFIEDGNLGGKGSDAHKASVEGDTFGDPLKDTAGPALNPMIKVVNLVSLMAAPVIVQYQGTTGSWIFAFVLIAIFIWAVSQSKKQSPSLS